MKTADSAISSISLPLYILNPSISSYSTALAKVEKEKTSLKKLAVAQNQYWCLDLIPTDENHLQLDLKSCENHCDCIEV